MKQYQKKAAAKGMAILMLCTSLCGCAQEQNTTPVVEVVPTAAVSSTDLDAVAKLSDIATTQYFTDETVDQDDMETIVQAGINAPSAMNGQPWHFSVITDAEVLEQISDGMGGGMGFGGMRPDGDGDMEMPEGMEIPGDGEASSAPAMPSGVIADGVSKAGIADAPLVIVISCKDGSELDAGLACQNMSATAQLLGYGTKIISSPTIALNGSEQDTYRELLGIPEEYSAAAILLIGYEDTSVDASVDGYTGATSRNSAEDMVTYLLSE